jgi:hypothetical protein
MSSAGVTERRLLTAADIERGPKPRFGTSGTNIGRLHSIGREIRARVERLDRIGAKAVNMVDSINCLLREAEPLCDPDGFVAFKERYCPELGRSRTYELLAVDRGSKTVEQIRAAGRARVVKHRAAQRLRSAFVTDNESVTSDAPHGDKVRVNGETVSLGKFSPAAQEQIAKETSSVVVRTTEEGSKEPVVRAEPSAEDVVDFIGERLSTSAESAKRVLNMWSDIEQHAPDVAADVRDDMAAEIRALIIEWDKVLAVVEPREPLPSAGATRSHTAAEESPNETCQCTTCKGPTGDPQATCTNQMELPLGGSWRSLA